MCVSVQPCVSHQACESQRQLWGLDSHFPPLCDSGDHTQVGKLAWQALFPAELSHRHPNVILDPRGITVIFFFICITMNMYINPFIAWKKANEEKLNDTWLLNFSLAYYKYIRIQTTEIN